MDILDEHIESSGTVIYISHFVEFEGFADCIFEIDNYNVKKLKV